MLQGCGDGLPEVLEILNDREVRCIAEVPPYVEKEAPGSKVGGETGTVGQQQQGRAAAAAAAGAAAVAASVTPAE
jgi:hypothetical protein